MSINLEALRFRRRRMTVWQTARRQVPPRVLPWRIW